MQSLFWILVFEFVILSFGLKCQTDEGLSEEDVKKIVKVCMRKIGNDYYEDGNSDNDEEETDDYKEESEENHWIRNRNQQDNTDMDSNNDYHYKNRDQLRPNQEGRWKRNDYYNPRYGSVDNWNRNRQESNDNSNNNRNLSMSDRKTDRDRACIVHCFFFEMKMTNDEQFPDKYKVMHIITKDIRDRQLRDFYSDSIQECFHILELDRQRQEKCDFSRKLVNCLAERARTNCDDWDNRTVIF